MASDFIAHIFCGSASVSTHCVAFPWIIFRNVSFSSHHLQHESTNRALIRTGPFRGMDSIHEATYLTVNVPSYFFELSLQLATHPPPAAEKSAHHLPTDWLYCRANLRDSNNRAPGTDSQVWIHRHKRHLTSYTMNTLICMLMKLIAHRLPRPHPSLYHLQRRSRHERARCHHTLAPDHVFVLFGAPLDRERDRL